jgi:hypothetical protein
MQVKIASCTKEVRPLRGDESGTLYTGIKINEEWWNIAGDHRNLYNKTVDLTIIDEKKKIVNFRQPQTPPAPAQKPPPPVSNGHTPRWPDRDTAVAAYIFYAEQVSKYLNDPMAVARAANCLIMMEQNGEINPVNREPGSDDGRMPF